MPLRLLQVGLGSCGRHWLSNILPYHRDSVELVGLVDVSPQALLRAQQLHRIAPTSCFPTIEEALATVECDGVLIVTPIGAHVPMALAALKAGKHVLLEKPFTPTLEEAREVIQVAKDMQRVLLINQNYRYSPAVETVKTLLQEQRAGTPGVVSVDFRKNANTEPFEKNGHYRWPQPLLVDMAIHHFDLMRYILQRKPLSISCQAWNPSWSKFVDPAVATATITFEDNIVVSYRGSWVSSGPETSWGGEWRVECSNGEIAWGARSETGPDHVLLRLPDQTATALDLPDMALRTDWHGSLCAFVEAVTEGKEPVSSGEDNLNTLALTFAAVASAREGRPVAIDL